jgi:hypothetical protein
MDFDDPRSSQLISNAEHEGGGLETQTSDDAIEQCDDSQSCTSLVHSQEQEGQLLKYLSSEDDMELDVTSLLALNKKQIYEINRLKNEVHTLKQQLALLPSMLARCLYLLFCFNFRFTLSYTFLLKVIPGIIEKATAFLTGGIDRQFPPVKHRSLGTLAHHSFLSTTPEVNEGDYDRGIGGQKVESESESESDEDGEDPLCSKQVI